MKKVISFALWGNNPKYTTGAIRNVELAKEVYPDWICRFYVGTSVPVEINTKLKELGAEVFSQSEEGNWTGMFWRFLAISDPEVDVMIVRDCDSRVSLREKVAVDQWLASDKLFHIMRDHPCHATQILGGMWGVRKPLLSNIDKIIARYQKGNFWQVDQNFLREQIYPYVQHTAHIHDEFFENKSFPLPRIGLEFVGQVYDENDKPTLEFENILRDALIKKK